MNIPDQPLPDKKSSLLIIGRLLPYTYTRNQAIKRLRLIKEFLNFAFFTNQTGDDFNTLFEKFKSKYLRENALSDIKELNFIHSLGVSFFKLFTPATLHLQLEQLEEQLLKNKTITLHIPFDLPDESVQELGVWFKQNLDATVLFNVVLDPTLIAGCAISFNGNYRDYSIKSKLKNTHTEVLNLLNSFKNKS